MALAYLNFQFPLHKAAKPDVVLIQFGHNDSHARGRPEATDASTDFRDNLRTYVTESIALGATPILVTPMHRRTFNAGGTLLDILKPYAVRNKGVSQEQRCQESLISELG